MVRVLLAIKGITVPKYSNRLVFFEELDSSRGLRVERRSDTAYLTTRNP